MGYEKSKGKRQSERKSVRNKAVGGWVMAGLECLGDFIATVTNAGNAILLAGADVDSLLTVSIYSDGEREKYYVRPRDDIREIMIDILEDYCSPRAVEAFTERWGQPEGKDTPTP